MGNHQIKLRKQFLITVTSIGNKIEGINLIKQAQYRPLYTTNHFDRNQRNTPLS